MERTDGDDVVPLTHEQLATLLGVGRSYASRVIQTFKAEGILETRRGSILVRDRDALRDAGLPLQRSGEKPFRGSAARGLSDRRDQRGCGIASVISSKKPVSAAPDHAPILTKAVRLARVLRSGAVRYDRMGPAAAKMTPV